MEVEGSGCVFAHVLEVEFQNDAIISGHGCWGGGALHAPDPTVPGKLPPESNTEPGEAFLSAQPHLLFAQQ